MASAEQKNISAGERTERTGDNNKASAGVITERTVAKNEADKKKTPEELERVKQLAERERAIEEEKANKEKRERILRSVERATVFIRNALQNNLVHPKDRARYEWVLQSVEEARNASTAQNKDVVKREAVGADGNKISRMEGFH